MKHISHKLLLLVIVIVASVVRLSHLESVPPSLSWDEVSIGYNAYSILMTGRDEHGTIMPLDAFAGYGDYKPPLSIYLTIPFVAIFGLNEVAVRLPSALSGILSVFLMYGVIVRLFSEYASRKWLGVIGALVLAISPWHIQLSRAGFEANIAVFLILLGVHEVLRSKTDSRALIWCWVPFVLSMYTFNSARYFVLFLGPALLWYIHKSAVHHIQKSILGIGIGMLFLLPLLPFLISPEARLRFAEVNIFSDLSIVEESNTRQELHQNSLFSKIFHNRRVGYAKEFMVHFLDHLQPEFLFIRGDGNPKFSTQDTGQLYIVEAVLLVIGVFALFRDRRDIAVLLCYWIVAAIIPAATARETPHALRIENSLPALLLFISYGLLFLIQSIHTVRVRRAITIFIGICYISNFLYFIHGYAVHYPREYSGEWQYGYREAIQRIQPIKNQYDRVLLTESIGRAYMYVLFYEHVDPSVAQTDVIGGFDAAGFYNVTKLNEYEFVKEGVGELQDQVLYVLQPGAVPAGVRVIETIYKLNGEPALVIFSKT